MIESFLNINFYSALSGNYGKNESESLSVKFVVVELLESFEV